MNKEHGGQRFLKVTYSSGRLPNLTFGGLLFKQLTICFDRRIVHFEAMNAQPKHIKPDWPDGNSSTR